MHYLTPLFLRKIENRLIHERDKLLDQAEDMKVAWMLRKDERPIYHVHIRKTGGTSINIAFLSNQTKQDGAALFRDLAKKRNNRILRDKKVFVGWNLPLINQGDFSFAFSHAPLHQLTLPAWAIIFTCLRDPVKRVISHYNMLKGYQINKIDHPCMKNEGPWLGSSFSNFLDNIPRKHLLNQLYMFSKTFEINEALDNLLSLDKIIYNEDFASGLASLEEITGWRLPLSSHNQSVWKTNLEGKTLARLREQLEPEYQLIEKLKEAV